MELVPPEPADDEAERLRRAGRRLRDWRRTQMPPLSREAFAKRRDVSIGGGESFAAGTRTTPPAKIARMVAVLGVTADQIFSEEDFPDPRAVTLLRTHPLLRDLR